MVENNEICNATAKDVSLSTSKIVVDSENLLLPEFLQYIPQQVVIPVIWMVSRPKMTIILTPYLMYHTIMLQFPQSKQKL